MQNVTQMIGDDNAVLAAERLIEPSRPALSLIEKSMDAGPQAIGEDNAVLALDKME